MLPLCVPHHSHGVFDDEQAVPSPLESVQDLEERRHVLRMQSRRWFVEDVDDPEKIRAELRREPESL